MGINKKLTKRTKHIIEIRKVNDNINSKKYACSTCVFNGKDYSSDCQACLKTAHLIPCDQCKNNGYSYSTACLKCNEILFSKFNCEICKLNKSQKLHTGKMLFYCNNCDESHNITTR
jgi:hypothetical protein